MKKIFLVLACLINIAFAQAENVARLEFTAADEKGTLILVDIDELGYYTNLVLSFENSLLISYKLNDKDKAKVGNDWTARLVEGDLFKSFKIMLTSPQGIDGYLIRRDNPNIPELIKLNAVEEYDINQSDSLFHYSQSSNILYMTKKFDFTVLSLTVFDLNGSAVYKELQDQGQYYIDLKNLSSGTLFIEARLPEKIILKKYNYLR